MVATGAKRQLRVLSLFFVTMTLNTAVVGNAIAQQHEPSLAQFFPASTAIFVQAVHPDELIGKIERHRLVRNITELPIVQKQMQSPELVMAWFAKGMLESQIGESLLESVKTNVSRGLAIGIDMETEGIAILFQSSDETKLKRLAGAVLKMAAGVAKDEGKPVPFKKVKYRDAITAEFDDFVVARYQTLFIVSNKTKLTKQIVDNLMDRPSDSLATQEWFQKAALKPNSDVSIALDLATIRAKVLNETGGNKAVKQLFHGRAENPAAELLLGGLFDAMQHGPRLTADIQLTDKLDVSFHVPFQPEWANPSRRFFYGEQLNGAAPARLHPANVVADVVAYRDVAEWWLSKEELFTEDVIAAMAQADSQLSTVFSGMDFGEDVLGALEPGVQIVVTEKQFGEAYVPDIRLPAFALVGKLKQPQEIRRKLKIAFQSVVGFANLGLGMNSQPQLDLETETIGDAKISSTSYAVDDESDNGLLLFNFSPTIAFQGAYLIISSDRDLAVELAGLAAETSEPASVHAAEGASAVNTRIHLDATVLSQILAINQEALIANNMLEKGHGRKKAGKEIAGLLTAIDWVRDGTLEFAVLPDHMDMKFQLTFVE